MFNLSWMQPSYRARRSNEIAEIPIFYMHKRMNWASIRFDWNQVRAFLVTAEEGTLSAAARALNLTQPTLGRQVSALEEDLGVTLFERVGRNLHLTEAGQALLSHVQAMGEAAHRVSLVAAGQKGEVAGDVRLSASDGLAIHLLPELVGGLRALAPEIRLQIIAENRISDLMRREADIAIRHVEPTEPELIGRRLKDGAARLYAASSWVQKNGRPQSLEELAQADMVSADDPERTIAALRRFGVDLPGLHVPLQCENTGVVWELVKAGHGLSIMSDAIASRTPGVEPIDIPGLPVIRFPVWLITHREIRTAKRIRVVFDYFAEAINGRL